jgi:hypothetical protein
VVSAYASDYDKEVDGEFDTFSCIYLEVMEK